MTPTTLPASDQGYIAASNAFDADAVIAWYADDAIIIRNEPTPAWAEG